MTSEDDDVLVDEDVEVKVDVEVEVDEVVEVLDTGSGPRVWMRQPPTFLRGASSSRHSAILAACCRHQM